MGKLEFNGCKLKVQLEAQSPIIHFQHDQAGATLRASEVKPKLDRFLLNKMEQEAGKRVAVLKKDNGYAVMFTDKEHNALNYRMNFEVPGNAYGSGKAVCCPSGVRRICLWPGHCVAAGV